MKFTKKVSINLIILFFILHNGCASFKAVEYREIENFSITSISTHPEFRMDIKMNNPNGVGAKIKSLDMEVLVNQTLLAKFETDNKIRVNSNGDFTIPLKGNASLFNLAKMIPPTIGNFFGMQDIPVNFKGEVVVSKFIFRKKISFDYTENINRDKIKTTK